MQRAVRGNRPAGVRGRRRPGDADRHGQVVQRGGLIVDARLSLRKRGVPHRHLHVRLVFHEQTTQIPHEVYLAVARNAEPPRVEYPPVHSFRFGEAAFAEGIELHDAGSARLRVYRVEKTLADCFKFRTTVGLDTCPEALHAYRARRRFDAGTLLRYAAVCRVATVMRPYLQAVL